MPHTTGKGNYRSTAAHPKPKIKYPKAHVGGTMGKSAPIDTTGMTAEEKEAFGIGKPSDQPGYALEQWKRVNESRKTRGLPALPKPGSRAQRR